MGFSGFWIFGVGCFLFSGFDHFISSEKKVMF